MGYSALLESFPSGYTLLRDVAMSQRLQSYGVIFISVALLLGGLLAFAEYRRNSLNDSGQAHQRTGVLFPPYMYRSPMVDGEPRPGHRAVFFFARSLANDHLFSDLADQADLASATDLIVVTPDGSRPLIEQGIKGFVGDSDHSIARAFGLRPPIDGGPPVGYVLVDAEGYIRFRTLDPGFSRRTWEIKLLLGDMP
jgi:hypothetical protein